ncbi:MAG: L-histidine N(alpha)-methyltransferase [Candidatus Thermoplasmatota archaeon]|nr:L-histidine N(alpha)-methyltransferase [Candidatus Thermoplasmatota archaeon]
MNDPEPEIIDLKPDLGDFRAEFLRGMTSVPKEINPKFFYDETGTRLFDEITRLEEYYPTRTEVSILREHCNDLSHIAGLIETVVELGSGNGEKGKLLMNCMPDLKRYVFVDISMAALKKALDSASDNNKHIERRGICSDFSGIDRILDHMFPEAKMVVFLGSTLGNMEQEEVIKFLNGLSGVLNRGDLIMIGVDLKKDKYTMEAAYNDRKGVTAKFNLNIIARAERELSIPLSPRDFSHLAFYNEQKGRIEMHLVALKDISFELDGVTIEIKRGERIHTENSYKYNVEEISENLKKAGFQNIGVWKDSMEKFAIINAQR